MISCYKCIGVGGIAISASIAMGDVPGAVYNPVNGHYYAQVAAPTGILWEDAKAAAELLTFAGVNGHLATITSAEENQFIIDNLNDAVVDMYWLGGFQAFDPAAEADPSAGWQWVTGEAWSYTNWNLSGNEPNDSGPTGEDVLRLWRQDWWQNPPSGNHPLGVWNDDPVDHAGTGFVVEFLPANVPAPATGALLIAAGLISRRRRRS